MRRVLLVAAALLLAGCKPEITVEVFATDLATVAKEKNQVMAEASVTVPVMMMPDKCREEAPKIVAALSKRWDKEIKLVSCDRIDTSTRLNISIPVAIVSAKPGENIPSDKIRRMLAVAVIPSTDPSSPPGALLVTIAKLVKLEVVNKDLQEVNVFAPVEWMGSRITLIVRGEGAPMRLDARAAFVNDQPIGNGFQTFSVDRKKPVSVRISDVGTARFVTQGMAEAFFLIP